MRLARGNDIIVRLLDIHHQPHRFDIVLRITPVAPRIEVAHKEFFLQAELDARGRARDLPRDEGLAPAFRLVIEQNAVARKQSVRFTIIHRDVIRVSFRTAVRRARMKRGLLRLRCLDYFSVKLRR